MQSIKAAGKFAQNALKRKREESEEETEEEKSRSVVQKTSEAQTSPGISETQAREGAMAALSRIAPVPDTAEMTPDQAIAARAAARGAAKETPKVTPVVGPEMTPDQAIAARVAARGDPVPAPSTQTVTMAELIEQHSAPRRAAKETSRAVLAPPSAVRSAAAAAPPPAVRSAAAAAGAAAAGAAKMDFTSNADITAMDNATVLRYFNEQDAECKRCMALYTKKPSRVLLKRFFVCFDNMISAYKMM
jgi:hypothetical protein